MTVALIRATAEASHLTQDIVAAQLDQLRAESPDDPDWTLLFHTAGRSPQRAVTTERRHLPVALDALRTSNHWLQALGLQLYLGVETLIDDDARELRDAVDTLPVYARRDAAVALSVLRPDLCIPDHDAATRVGVASVAAVSAVRDGRPLDALSFLRDRDLTVREHAADHLTNLTEADRAAAQTALDEPATQWTCLQCGQTCDASEDRCDGSHPRPRPSLE